MRSIIIGSLMLLIPVISMAADLKLETIESWNHFTASAEARMKTRLEAGKPFLWSDEDQQRNQRLRRGEILVTPASGSGTVAVPNGLVHDWVGAVFIPNTTIAEVVATVQDYDHYKKFYRPAVVDSRLIGRSPNGDEEKFSMVWVHRALFASAALISDYSSKYFVIDSSRMYSLVYSTVVQEIQGYGEAGERRLRPGTGSGYIWRLYAITRYQQRDGGVYVEVEAIALSRDIPLSLRWLARPLVERLSRDSLITSLRQTREAVGYTKNLSLRAANRR